MHDDILYMVIVHSILDNHLNDFQEFIEAMRRSAVEG